MATLETWFEKKDYREGLLLLAKYCKNRALLRNLNKKKNAEKLFYELKKIAQNMRVVILKKPEAPKKVTEAKPVNENKLAQDPDMKTIIRNNKVVDIDQLPSDIKKLWEQNRSAYKEIRVLSEKLKLMEKASDEDRRPLTERMIELDDMVRDNWEVIDAWQPGQPEKNGQKNEIIDHKRINANRKYISTNLEKLQAGIDEKKAELIRENIRLRVKEIKEAGEEISQKTIDELAKVGV